MRITTADTALLCWRTFDVQVRWCAVALLLVLAGASDCARADPGAVFNYDIRYGPFRVMTMRLTVHVEDDRYQASSDGRTVGVIGTLFPWSAASSSSGLRSGGVMHPLRFRSAGEYRGQRRSADVDYDAAGSVRARSDPPPEADDRDPVPLALQQSTVDPLTAGLTAVLSGCQGRLNVFDGRRRYDLLLSDLGEADAPSAGDAFYSGRARHCRADIEPRAGFWRSQPSTERPSQIDGWIASPRPGLPPAPVYLELTAARGTLTISLASIEPLPASGSSGSAE